MAPWLPSQGADASSSGERWKGVLRCDDERCIQSFHALAFRGGAGAQNPWPSRDVGWHGGMKGPFKTKQGGVGKRERIEAWASRRGGGEGARLLTTEKVPFLRVSRGGTTSFIHAVWATLAQGPASDNKAESLEKRRASRRRGGEVGEMEKGGGGVLREEEFPLSLPSSVPFPPTRLRILAIRAKG